MCLLLQDLVQSVCLLRVCLLLQNLFKASAGVYAGARDLQGLEGHFVQVLQYTVCGPRGVSLRSTRAGRAAGGAGGAAWGHFGLTPGEVPPRFAGRTVAVAHAP